MKDFIEMSDVLLDWVYGIFLAIAIFGMFVIFTGFLILYAFGIFDCWFGDIARSKFQGYRELTNEMEGDEE